MIFVYVFGSLCFDKIAFQTNLILREAYIIELLLLPWQKTLCFAAEYLYYAYYSCSSISRENYFLRSFQAAEY